MVQKLFVTVFGAAFLLTAGVVYADWDPADGHKMHFPQYPNEYGWNVYASEGNVLADDWTCSEDGFVFDIHFWGSWENGNAGTIETFHIWIFENITAQQSGTGYSMPGAMIWEGHVSDFDIRHIVPVPEAQEGWLNPHSGDAWPYNHTDFYQYNIQLTAADEPFYQYAGEIYWLGITADVVTEADLKRWGWKTSYLQWEDDAVYYSDATWAELTEPDMGPIQNTFHIELDTDSNLVAGYGDYAYDDTWYRYDDADPYLWYNIWFYDHPLAFGRWKEIFLGGAYHTSSQDGQGGTIRIVVNWSTPQWSEVGNPPGERRRPPRPEDLTGIFPGEYLQRSQILFEGTVTDVMQVLPELDIVQIWEYNPEWVSVDVWGNNLIFDGWISHACAGQTPASLDLAFVITGGEEPILGACCWDDGTCTDPISQFDCENPPGGIPGTYMGDGFTCAGDGNGNGVDDLCESVVQMGACCYGSDPLNPICVNTTQTICQSAVYNGTWYVGQDCANFVCPTGTTGACCYDNGLCVDGMTATDCATSGGDYGGDGSQCAETDIDDNGVDDFCDGIVTLGACCWGDQHQPYCTNTTQSVCPGPIFSGTWYANEDCANFTCPVPQGACCYGDPADPSCVNTGVVDCQDNYDGTWYAGEDCADFTCPTVQPELKWQQLPDLNCGADVNCTYNEGSGINPYLLANDFECISTGQITKIHVYGSWYHDVLPYGSPDHVRFILSIHEDIPDPDGTGPAWSRPGDIVCLIEYPPYQIVQYATDIVEGWLEPGPLGTTWEPNADHTCWEYIFDVSGYDCFQQGTEDVPKVYWLDVQAYPEDQEAWFGWKTVMATQNWNDDACYAFDVDDASHAINWRELIWPQNQPCWHGQSVDLAFAIYGIEGQPQIGACCYETGVCTDGMTQADCEASGGDYGSDGSQCAGVDTDLNDVDDFCDDIVTLGACCYGNPISPSCINTTQYLCELAGGGYAGTWYAGQDCATFTCPVAGACCYEDAASGWTCTITSDAATCESLTNGTWYEGVDCASIDCPDIPTGACCYGDPADPSCVNTTQALCQSQYNGTWYSGEDCATFTCPTTPTAACCYGSPVAAMQCINTTQALCQSQYNGTWYSGEDCANFTCPTGPIGACCLDDGLTCQNLSQEDCQNAGGRYEGDGTVCLGDSDQNGRDDACEGKMLKWIQPPDVQPTGMDVCGMDELVLASDFLCQTTGPIKEIHVWGSWFQDEFPGHPGEVAFTLSFHMDIPADQSPTTYSVPGELICRLYEFKPGEFEVREWPNPVMEGEGWYNPIQQYYVYPGDFMIWEYIFRLPDDYNQLCYQEGTDQEPVVYWLDVQARSIVGPSPFLWGWKTTPLELQWNDNSVWSPSPMPIVDPGEWMELYYPPDHIAYPDHAPLDLAFAIYNETPCCIGQVGNANGIGTDVPTIGDVSVMIDALFISGDINVIACLPEADINQSGGLSVYPADITIGDISTLIDYLFITGPSLGLRDCL